MIKKTKKPGIRILVFTLAVTAVISVGIFILIDTLIKNINRDFAYGIMVDGLDSRLAVLSIAAASGLAALMLLSVCLQVYGHVAFAKPLHRLRTESEKRSQNDKSVVAKIQGVKKDAAESGNMSHRLSVLSSEISGIVNEVAEGTSQTAAALRHIFENVAAVDDAVAILANNADARYAEAGLELARLRAAASGHAISSHTASGHAASSHALSSIAPDGVLSSVSNEMRKASGAGDDFYSKTVAYIDALQAGKAAISEKIDSCATVVKGITAQANLLSLSAAIEAAKAGDAGRGFAGIADDIRAHADDLRGAVLAIYETSEQFGAQAALIEELSSLAASAGTGNAASRSAIKPDDQASVNADDSAAAGKNAQAAAQADAESGAGTTNRIVVHADVRPDAGTDDRRTERADDSATAPAVVQTAEFAPEHAGGVPAATETEARHAPQEYAADSKPFDSDGWDAAVADVKEGFNAIRTAVRSVGVASAKASETASINYKNANLIKEKNVKIEDCVKIISKTLEKANERLASI